MLGANPDNDSDNESVDLGWTKLHASSKKNSHMAALAQGVDPMLLAMEFAVIKDPTSKPVENRCRQRGSARCRHVCFGKDFQSIVSRELHT